MWRRYRISRRAERSSGNRRRDGWQTIASGTSSQPFLLDDETGQCIVQPDGAEVVPAESTTWYGDTPWPASGPDRKLSLTGGRGYRYVEDRIYEHERLYALGDFRSTASSGELDPQAELAQVLAEWKEDQPALLQRFDRDGDGRIDMVEWEAARQEARRTLSERGAERPPRQILHVLGRSEGEFGTYKLLELQGEKVAELKGDGKLASGDDTVAAVISKLRPLLEEKAQSLGENGAQPEFYIEPGDHITLIFNGHKMREDSLFYADNFMMLSAWVQVYLHSCEFEKIIERASELRSQDRGA